MGYSFILWIFGGYWIYRIIVTAIENDRITKVAKIEARLKQELSQRYADPGAVERILAARLQEPQALRHRAEHECGGERQRELIAEAEVRLGDTRERTEDYERHRQEKREGQLLGGLITFLLGLAFCASAYFVEIDPLYIPGFLLGAIGLALLTFATSQNELARATQRSGQAPEARS